MSNTPYFDAYEARRRNKNRLSTTGTLSIGNNSLRYSGQVLQSNVNGNSTLTPNTNGVTINFPSYRVVKQYNIQGALSDFTIEMRQDTNAEWTPLPEVVRYA